jgi:hypothetical protein
VISDAVERAFSSPPLLAMLSMPAQDGLSSPAPGSGLAIGLASAITM